MVLWYVDWLLLELFERSARRLELLTGRSNFDWARWALCCSLGLQVARAGLGIWTSRWWGLWALLIPVVFAWFIFRHIFTLGTERWVAEAFKRNVHFNWTRASGLMLIWRMTDLLFVLFGALAIGAYVSTARPVELTDWLVFLRDIADFAWIELVCCCPVPPSARRSPRRRDGRAFEPAWTYGS